MIVRAAAASDVGRIAGLLAGDGLGRGRDAPGDARRFYGRLGFVAPHWGMKREL